MKKTNKPEELLCQACLFLLYQLSEAVDPFIILHSIIQIVRSLKYDNHLPKAK